MEIGFRHLLLSVVVTIFISVTAASIYWNVLFNHSDLSQHAEYVECVLSSRGNQAAMGEVLVLRVNGTKTVSVQASQCVNMENVLTGDKIKAVVVRDSRDILQCVVRVEDVD